jgi:ABC-type multidrug transport system permease subunit
MLVGREMREGTLARLQLSRLSGAEWIGGMALSQMLIAVFQVLLTIAAAALFGFRASGGSLGLAVGVGLLLSLSAVATGLVVGRFARSDSDAINVGSVFTMLQVFLSGSFFAMPGPTIFRLGGVPLGFYDLLPATHATLILQQVLVGGADLAFVAARLAVMAGLTVGLAGACLVIFRRKLC